MIYFFHWLVGLLLAPYCLQCIALTQTEKEMKEANCGFAVQIIRQSSNGMNCILLATSKHQIIIIIIKNVLDFVL